MIEGITHPARGEVRPFCCNLCPRSVTDLTNSIQYPSTSTVVRLMCSGKAEPSIILRSFDLGFDGVLILGCYLGDHRGISKDGDIGKRVEITKELMQTLGLEQDRLLLEGISASDPELTVIAKGFIDKLKNLGPSPLRRGVVC
jgi:coenzyme F420-reducing hydrogenase delta subunit